MKRAAERAPIWVIAIMAHVAAAAILGMLYVREAPPDDADEPTLRAFTSDRRQMLEGTVVIDLPRPDRLPTVREAGPTLDDGDPRHWQNPFAGEDHPEASDHGRPDGMAGGLRGAGADHLGTTAPGTIGTGVRPAGGVGQRTGFWPNPRSLRISQVADLQNKIPVVKGGLRWLREHQSDDGAWDCDGFGLRCDPRLGSGCDGAGSGNYDVGVTGLALLAFLGAGCDGSGRTPNDEAVRNGLRWLRASQDVEGCFGSRADSRFTYAHACATIAMCEAATFNKSPSWRKSAEAAIAFVQACQNPYGGWRYGVRTGESDASVTGWMLLALKAGRDAGFEVSERAIRDGLAFLDAVTDEQGRTGYRNRGELPVRPDGYVDRWPARETESLTAVALCSRIFLARKGPHPMIAPAARLLAAKMPRWDEAAGTIDMYYWYHGTLAMHQLGGADWERWNAALEKAVVATQRIDGCADGSWDPKGPWGLEGGRVYATALMTLCYEVYWRYPLVFGARSEFAKPR